MWDADDLDDEGRWIGPCDRCGTNHEGYPPGTVGGERYCLTARAEALGEPGLLAQVDQMSAHIDFTRDTALRDAGVIP